MQTRQILIATYVFAVQPASEDSADELVKINIEWRKQNKSGQLPTNWDPTKNTQSQNFCIMQKTKQNRQHTVGVFASICHRQSPRPGMTEFTVIK